MKARIGGGQVEYDVRGAGPAVLFLHAFPLGLAMWDPQAEALAPRHQVIRFDARGFGGSPPGDGLLTMAFEVLSNPRLQKRIPANRVLSIIREIATASGVFGMVGGQVVDIQSEGREIDFPTLEYIHTHKTGALIRASVRVGALYSRAGTRWFGALTRYGELVGLAFQIADDILDITGKEEELGKDIGSDLEKSKKTFPSFIGLEESRRRAEEVVQKAIGALKDFDRKADPLRELAKYIINRIN